MIIINNMITEFIHTTTAARCCKQIFRILGRRINTEDKALKSKYLEFWKDKKADENDRIHLAKLDAKRISIDLQKELVQKAQKLRKIFLWKEIGRILFKILIVWFLLVVLFWIVFATLNDIANVAMMIVLGALCIIEFIMGTLPNSFPQLKVSGRKEVEKKLDKAIENKDSTLSFIDEIKENEEKIFKSNRFEFSITS